MSAAAAVVALLALLCWCVYRAGIERPDPETRVRRRSERRLARHAKGGRR